MPAKNHDDQAPRFCLAAFLPYKLAIATESVSRIFAENYDAVCNLTIPEVRALAVVAQHGVLSPTAVGQLTMMDKVKVSRAAQSLVGKGLLRQSQDPSDGRGRLLRLTRKGTATHARFVPIAFRIQAEVFDELSPAEMTALNRILAKITTRLETTRGTEPD
jgi:DNA-binding MarR family transcriptional regulator